MNTLKIGDKIPVFECLDNTGNIINSDDLMGKKLIVFFYPRANTPGCTAEACNISDNYGKLDKMGYNILVLAVIRLKLKINSQVNLDFNTHF